MRGDYTQIGLCGFAVRLMGQILAFSLKFGRGTLIGSLMERSLRPGSPALLIAVCLLLMFICHAVTASIARRKGVFMTKLQSVTKSVFASVVKSVSESVGAVGAEVTAAYHP